DIIDSNGFYLNPFEFYLEAGENTISLDAVREPVVISSITIYPYEDKISYSEYIAGKQEVTGVEPIYIQAELPTATSDYTIYPIYDRKSSITMPQHHSLIKLNTIGSEKWQTPGQWIEYTFTVEKAGLYEIAARFRQNELNGLYTSRKIYIDGVVPFEEANGARFNYNGNWQIAPLGDGTNEFQFYLEPGEHTIRLEVTLGDMGEIAREVSEAMKSINEDYLEIIRLTGATPDENRDYKFGQVIPEVIRDLILQGRRIDAARQYLETMGGIKSQNSTTLEQIAFVIAKMADERQIAANVTNLKDQIASIGDWLSTIQNQPLELDYLLVQPASSSLPKADANFWQKLWYEFKQFIASFFTDYTSIAAGAENSGAIDLTMWTVTARDQAQIMRSLIDSHFVPKTGYNVSLKLVASSALLPSVLSGVGPDIALPDTGVDVINFAIRSAIVPINPEAYADKAGDDVETRAHNAKMRTLLSNFDEIAQRFPASAFTAHTLYGAVYGLPDEMSWPMLFYRTDILAGLGLEVPETWDELLAMVPVLQFNNMEIGLSTDYNMYLYQLGGDMWVDDGMRINLDSNKALSAFETMCNMFTQYSLPMSYDFANRFKTGEMPIAISAYGTYNTLTLFASEIAGLWEFGPIPGFEREDGTINNVAIVGSTVLSMMAGCRNHEAAWEFMCWYTDTEFQVNYSNELVALLGPAAKRGTANLEAFAELPWTAREYSQLMKQMTNSIGIPAYPGNYIISRYTNFALLAAYNDNADPVDELLRYINDINKELTRKRKEFDLETLEIGQTLADKRLGQATDEIDKLDGYLKETAEVKAALAAINSRDIAELRAAIAGMSGNNRYTTIVKYLTDAANALQSYLDSSIVD
nr:extracellular solute-binding protein [Clostridia bacterium]